MSYIGFWGHCRRRYGETYAQAAEATGDIPSGKAAALAQMQEHRAFGDGGRVHAKIGRVLGDPV